MIVPASNAVESAMASVRFSMDEAP
jgi:hypothetical protein